MKGREAKKLKEMGERDRGIGRERKWCRGRETEGERHRGTERERETDRELHRGRG